jgi:hypothetical protein
MQGSCQVFLPVFMCVFSRLAHLARPELTKIVTLTGAIWSAGRECDHFCRGGFSLCQ